MVYEMCRISDSFENKGNVENVLNLFLSDSDFAYYVEQICIKSDAKKVKVIKYHKLLCSSIIISFWPVLWP